MKTLTAKDAFNKLKGCIDIKYYIGKAQAQLIQDACNQPTEAEKRPPSNFKKAD